MGARWEMTPWSDCPVECGGGRRRSALCLNSTTGLNFHAIAAVKCPKSLNHATRNLAIRNVRLRSNSACNVHRISKILDLATFLKVS